MTSEHVDDDDLLIQISPILNENSHWTGKVEINIIASDDSSLVKEEMEALLFFCQMICASVPIYEEHETIREMAAWLVNQKYPAKEKLNGGQKRAEIISTENNVITIDFNPKKES